MNKVMYSIILLALFLNSCSSTPYWKFKLIDTNSRVYYYASEWRCFYEPSGSNIWVECYKKDSADTAFFYATEAMFSEGK